MSSLSYCIVPADPIVEAMCAELAAAENAMDTLSLQCMPQNCTPAIGEALATANRDAAKWEVAIRSRLDDSTSDNIGFIYEKPVAPANPTFGGGVDPKDVYAEQILVVGGIIAAILACSAIYYVYRALGGWKAIEIVMAQYRRKIAARAKPKPGYHRRGR